MESKYVEISRIKKENSELKLEKREEIDKNDAIFNLIKDIVEDGAMNGYNPTNAMSLSIGKHSGSIRKFISDVVENLKKVTHNILCHPSESDQTVKLDAS